MTTTSKQVGFQRVLSGPGHRMRARYVASLDLDAAQGAAAIWRTVCGWLRTSRRESLERELLVRQGTHPLASGSLLDVIYTDSQSPYLHVVRYSHPDANIAGRRWVTEIGLRAEDGAATIQCSVMLATEDVALGQLPAIRATRPALVWKLVQWNAPTAATPGLAVRRLDEENASANRAWIRDEDRKHPVVVISATPQGAWLVEPEDLRRLVVGIADVITIASDVDTRALARTVGEDAIPWAGGVRILYPPSASPYADRLPLRSFSPQDIDDLRIQGDEAAQHIFSLLAERTARSNLGRHVTLERVREERIRRGVHRTQAAQDSVFAATEAENQRRLRERLSELESDVEQYEEILTERDAEITNMRSDLDHRELEIDDLSQQLWNAESQGKALKLALERATDQPSRHGEGIGTEAREAIIAVAQGDGNLSDALMAASSLFADRVVVLDSAWRSAERADGFQHVAKAFELLIKLLDPYWTVLAQGGSDGQARAIFGNAFAATESESVASNSAARKRRTFKYKGESVLMLRHLKIGTKQSANETLRIHFEWDADTQAVIIGHCGAHLDFD